MKNVQPIVRDNYERYLSLVRDPKNTLGPQGIDLSQKKGGTNSVWNAYQLAVVHSSDPAEMTLITEIRVDRSHDFKFKLRAPKFMPEPLINYDSAGPTHRNVTTTALPEQAITTPHFNCYDEDGQRIAYKTSQLIDSTVAKQLEDISACVIHFYQEVCLKHYPADYPSISLNAPGTLPFASHTNADPHAHVVRFV